MLLDGSKVCRLVSKLHSQYDDSYRYIFLVVKWMIRRNLCYEDARDLCRQNKIKTFSKAEMRKITDNMLKIDPIELIKEFDLCVGDVPGKNDPVRSIICNENLGSAMHKAPTFFGASKIEILEDSALIAVRNLKKHGSAIIRGDLVYFEDKRFSKVRLDSPNLVDYLLDRRFGWWDPPNLDSSVDVVEEIFEIKLDRNVLADFFLVDIEDRTLETKLAELLYRSNRFCYDVCEMRIRSGLVYYENGFAYQECSGGRKRDLVTRVTDNFDKFDKKVKYESLCQLLKLESFPTGDLLGAGKFSLMWHNNFYSETRLGAYAPDGAKMKFKLDLDSTPLIFDPIRECVLLLSAPFRPRPFVCGSFASLEFRFFNKNKRMVNVFVICGLERLPLNFIVDPMLSRTCVIPKIELFGLKDGKFVNPGIEVYSDAYIHVDFTLCYGTYRSGKFVSSELPDCSGEDMAEFDID